MPVIGEAIRKAREAKNMTRGDLAHGARVSVETLRNIETKDGHAVQLDTVLQIAGYLGVPLYSIVRHPRRHGPWVDLSGA